MKSFKQNRVSEAVWRWQEETDTNPLPKGMNPKVKVLITTPIALLIAYGIFRWRGHIVMPSIVVGIALSIAFCGFFVPSAYAAIERGFLRFGAWVAVAMTWILLLPVYYLIFAPAHLLLRLRGRDPMERAMSRQRKTYWSKRPPVTRENYYRSQH